MNENKLSKRLERVAHYVPDQARVADIGSDHAYLPAWLVLNKKIQFAVAGEVVKGPFESAKSLVAMRQLENNIQVRLADGLEAVKKEDGITVATIAGMGGALISEILERGNGLGKLDGVERLILQPNVGEYTLRKWLQQNQFGIINEEIIKEDGKRYELIVAEREAGVSYSERELHFGPLLLVECSDLFKEKWAHEYKQKQNILSELKKATTPQEEKIQEIQQLLNWIEEVL